MCPYYTCFYPNRSCFDHGRQGMFIYMVIFIGFIIMQYLALKVVLNTFGCFHRKYVTCKYTMIIRVIYANEGIWLLFCMEFFILYYWRNEDVSTMCMETILGITLWCSRQWPQLTIVLTGNYRKNNAYLHRISILHWIKSQNFLIV